MDSIALTDGAVAVRRDDVERALARLLDDLTASFDLAAARLVDQRRDDIRRVSEALHACQCLDADVIVSAGMSPS